MLSEIPTADLVQELMKREAVESVTVEAYEPYTIAVTGQVIEDTGPAIILRVWD